MTNQAPHSKQVFSTVMNYHDIPVRSVLQDGHIFCDIYLQGCGWTPVECTMKNPDRFRIAWIR